MTQMSDCGLYGIDPKYMLPTTLFYRIIQDDVTVPCKDDRQVHVINEGSQACKECGIELPKETKCVPDKK